MRQVQDETLRLSSLASWSARYSDEDVGVCGYQILSGTPIIFALGVASKNTIKWTNEERRVIYTLNSPYPVNLGPGTVRNSELDASGNSTLFLNIHDFPLNFKMSLAYVMLRIPDDTRPGFI